MNDYQRNCCGYMLHWCQFITPASLFGGPSPIFSWRGGAKITVLLWHVLVDSVIVMGLSINDVTRLRDKIDSPSVTSRHKSRTRRKL